MRTTSILGGWELFMKVGDLVRTRENFYEIGLLVDIAPNPQDSYNPWTFVLWPSDGYCLEKLRDLEATRPV